MAKKPKRAALYLRVSTEGQTTENQSRALKAVLKTGQGARCRHERGAAQRIKATLA
jgi:DNA invertase Pin-like site-specific DNA recombinase